MNKKLCNVIVSFCHYCHFLSLLLLFFYITFIASISIIIAHVVIINIAINILRFIALASGNLETEP